MSQTPKLSSESMMILEQSLLKVPIEAMRKVHRTSSKAGDKDLASSETSLRRTCKLASRDEQKRQVDAALTKMRGIKRKLESASASQQQLVDSSKARVQHLQTLCSLDSFSARSYNKWAHLRLQRHLVDYLLRTGCTQSAKALSASAHLGGLSDVELDLFNELGRIEKGLRAGSATDALAWCKDNAVNLKRIKSALEFDLRFQEYIELARQRRHSEAIGHCKKYLISTTPSSLPAVSSAYAKQSATRVRQAMALLAFGPDTTCPPYRALYDTSRWDALTVTFRKAYMSIFSLPPLPLLNLSLWAGLAALKLPSCLSSDISEHNADCPTCDQPLFGSLAQAPEVPWGHHANSIIVCRVTGKVLAGEDTAYALPNGMVYSGEACEGLRDTETAKLRCPRTGQLFDWDTLKKVYIT